MTNKEARDYFQEEMIDGKCSDDCIPCNAMVKAYYALDKQIPKKPQQDKRKGDGCYCPVCGSFVGIKNEEVTDINNYCSECGQKMKQVTE